MSERLAQGPYVAARVGFEPTTLRSAAIDSTNDPLRPTGPYFHKAEPCLIGGRGTGFHWRSPGSILSHSTLPLKLGLGAPLSSNLEEYLYIFL